MILCCVRDFNYRHFCKEKSLKAKLMISAHLIVWMLKTKSAIYRFTKFVLVDSIEASHITKFKIRFFLLLKYLHQEFIICFTKVRSNVWLHFLKKKTINRVQKHPFLRWNPFFVSFKVLFLSIYWFSCIRKFDKTALDM